MKVFQSGEFVNIHMPAKTFELRMPLREVAGPDGMTFWASESSFKWLGHGGSLQRLEGHQEMVPRTDSRKEEN